MKPKKAIKELRKQLTADPANVVLRIRLASLLRDVGEHNEAVDHYLAVARDYDQSGRTGQAIAVCKGVLEFAPQNGHAHQLYAYLEGKRQAEQAQASDVESPLPPLGDIVGGGAPIPEPDSSRRKRPTSMPTPLKSISDRGLAAKLPGLRPTSTGRTGRVTDGPALSTRRLVPDNTVPGAPPKHDPAGGESNRGGSQRFRLQDLKQAAQTPNPADESRGTEQASNRLVPTPPLRLPLSPSGPPPRSNKPVLPLKPRPSRPSAVPPAPRSMRPSARPPAAMGPPTLQPPPTPTPPQGTRKSRGPSLEDATIVDANFDLAAFMAGQEAREEDLPDLPAGPGDVAQATKVARKDSAPSVEISMLGPLQGLPRYAIDALLEVATTQAYPDGTMVVREGEPLSVCRVVRSGSLRLLKNDPAARSDALVNFGTVGQGSLLGASTFMSRPASVDILSLGAAVAVGPVEVIEIPTEAIRALRERFPAAADTLELFYRERCTHLLMSSSPLFASLTEHDRAELVGMFEPVRAAPGQEIIEVGGNSGGFYLVLSGKLEVESQTGQCFSLLPGGYVGDGAVLQGNRSSATVRSVGTTELGRLDAMGYFQLISKHPQVWAEIWRVICRPNLAGMQLALGTAPVL